MRLTTLRNDAISRTGLCLCLSASELSRRPKTAVLIPAIAGIRPPLVIEPRTLDMRVRTPTIVMANGGLLTKARAENVDPTNRKVIRVGDDVSPAARTWPFSVEVVQARKFSLQ
jgi:hypothetical protein